MSRPVREMSSLRVGISTSCPVTVSNTKPRDWLGEHLRNDLSCVEWDVQPQSVNLYFFVIPCFTPVVYSLLPFGSLLIVECWLTWLFSVQFIISVYTESSVKVLFLVNFVAVFLHCSPCIGRCILCLHQLGGPSISHRYLCYTSGARTRYARA